MAYYGLIFPHLSYGIALWGGCANFLFKRLFVLQKKCVRIIKSLKYRESCRESFRELDLLTLPSLYILETVMFCRFKCILVQGKNIHNYQTRTRETYRVAQHRLQAHERLPSQTGVKFLNRLPTDITNIINHKPFKRALRKLLVSGMFYTVAEFMDPD